jgi:hypothetical protein
MSDCKKKQEIFFLNIMLISFKGTQLTKFIRWQCTGIMKLLLTQPRRMKTRGGGLQPLVNEDVKLHLFSKK